MRSSRIEALLLLVAATAVNAGYLAAFDSPTIFYHANVVAHVVLGIALAAALAAAGVRWLRRPAERASTGTAAATYGASAALMAGTGLFLAKVGTSTPYLPTLRVHEGASLVFLVVFLAALARRKEPSSIRRVAFAALALAVALPVAARSWQAANPAHVVRIDNAARAPRTPYDEGMGKEGPFFPSSNRTADGKLIRSDFFLESESCGNKGCHPDITAQWRGSAHHLSSFNNQWYRKSIEYMQDVVGTRPSKWCGGCHDMAILLTGRMDRPIREQIDTPEAQAGIGCLVCHSIVHVGDTMGQGGFTIEYPAMHKLAASHNPVLQYLHDKMVLLDPGPHKQALLKPFHRESTPEFCSSCHKVHLDEPVNHYRWFRGFNDYDAWQQSGVSGQGARAFYYPAEFLNCGSCHMPLIPSSDQGNVDGFVHSHRFPAANTALPVANQDREQFEVVKDFLTSGFLTVDIFAVSEEGAGSVTPAIAPPHPPPDATPVAASMIPDEGGLQGRAITVVPAREVVAPVDRAAPAARPGSTVRVDVVARTRRIGHFFPGGTVDAFDVWLELKAEDAAGKILFWSGWVDGGGKGPVDPGAHFYRSVMVDEHGNRINKRNAWASRAVAYSRLIPPGAAETAHFRVAIPSDAVGPVKLTARMNYRKFNWWNTQWAYAGVRDPAKPEFALDKGYDDGPWTFTGDTAAVSGKVKRVPDLPAIVVAQDVKTLALGDAPVCPPPDPKDRDRWNDFGIGLLLQRDFRGADAAFLKVVAIDPKFADGWVNLARVAIDEGDPLRALDHLRKAEALAPAMGKVHHFLGVALKATGRFDEALAHLERAAELFPRDRVVLGTAGRVLFLQRRYLEASAWLERVLRIDPEDIAAHYNLMLVYRGLGDTERSSEHERLYLRFKADEKAQFLTGDFRRLNPEDNRERQAIHEHDSSWPGEGRGAAEAWRGDPFPPAPRDAVAVARRR